MTEGASGAKVLNACVHVENPDTGHVEVFGPPGTRDADGKLLESDVPAWARKAITNPNVWVTPEELAAERENVPVAGPSQSTYFDLEEVEADTDEPAGAKAKRPRSRAR